MGDKTGIQWTDATWNPIRGCSRVSEGCRNCYAEKVASRFCGPGEAYEGLAKDGRWTGKVQLIEEHLDDPIRWKKPRRVFVNSMSDLFHDSFFEGLLRKDEPVRQIFKVMAAAKQHTFQVLTKRPDNMRRFMGWWMDQYGDVPPNVWLGVSVEDQKTADERIQLLMRTHAAVRFISAEPLLGPLNITPFLTSGGIRFGMGCKYGEGGLDKKLDWVIVGGESGPRARPFQLDWCESIVEQAKAAAVPVFVKQMGENAIWNAGSADWRIPFTDRKGADPAEWPRALRVRQFPGEGTPA